MNDNDVNASDEVPGQQNKEIEGKNGTKARVERNGEGKRRGWFYGNFSVFYESKEIFIGDKTPK